MKTIDKYIITKKISYLMSTFFTVFIFISVISFFENINMITKKNLPTQIVLKNVVLTSPFYTYLLTPIISMISSILLLNHFKSTSQYKAIYASGYSHKIFLKNILFVLIPFSILLLLVVDEVTSNLYSLSKKKIRYSQIINFKSNKIIFQSKLKENLIIEDAYMYDTENNKHLYLFKLHWDEKEKKWYGHNVNEIQIKGEKINFQHYNLKEIREIPNPNDFIIEELADPNSYSIKSLINRVNKLKSISINTNQELTLIFFRITIISMNIASAFIGFLLFKTNFINNKGTAATISIIVSLLMWFLLTILKRISDIEIISPPTILILQNLIVYSVIFFISKKIKHYA